MSSLLSVLQDWLRNDRTRSQQQQLRQDYENLVKLVSDYQHTMSEYQNNMNSYLLLLTSLQIQLLPSQSSTDETPRETQTSQSPTENPFSQRQSQPQTRPQRNSARSYPRDRRAGNRSYANVAASNPLNTLRPLITRYHPIQNTRNSNTTSFFTSPNNNNNETSRLFDSLVRENRGGVLNMDVCGNSLFGITSSENTENPWSSLFPPLSSTNPPIFGSGVLGGNSESSTTTNPPVNLIDIVFEYDDQYQQFNTPEGEASLQRMIQNDDFRNQILRAAGLNNHSNVMRWIVAPNGFEDSEQQGLTMDEIRSCTDSLIYQEGMEGLLSNVCPITMEDFVVGDRLLQLRDCRHAFRERELVEWFQRHHTCPVCRNRVVE
jgi:hypothetical protein